MSDQRVDSGTASRDDTAERSRALWPGFWPWLISTTVLAALVGVLMWYLETREPLVVEVDGPIPPPAAPSPELLERTQQLSRLIALRQAELRKSIDSLDPPVCTPPETVDETLLDKVRREEATNIAQWRDLLVPVTFDQGAAVPRRAVTGEEALVPAAPLRRRTQP